MSGLERKIGQSIEFIDKVSRTYRWLFWILLLPGLSLVLMKELLLTKRPSGQGKAEIIHEEKIGYCSLVQFSSSKYYLSLSLFDLSVDDEEINGHEWEDLLRYTARVRGVSTSTVRFDSEADTMGAISSSREPLVALAELITELVNDKIFREEMVQQKGHNH